MDQSLSSHPTERPLAEKVAGVSGLLELITIGLLTELIYIVYIVAFPIISSTHLGEPPGDLEILMKANRWFAPFYTLGLLALYYLFWQAMQLVAGISGQRASLSYRPSGEIADNPQPDPSSASGLTVAQVKYLVLAFGLLFGFTLVWLYPITANDLFRYVVRGRVWTIYGENPLVVPPSNFPDDPYLSFAGEFDDLPSVYGPLWEILIQIPLRLGATEIVPGVVSLKLLVYSCYLLSALLLGWWTRPERGSALTALTFFAWNPLILIQIAGNGHNDMVFMTFMLLGIIFWQRRNWWATTLMLSLAVLAKASALPLVPLFAVILLRNEPAWSGRLLKAAGAGMIGLVAAFLIYSFFGPITETLTGVDVMLTDRRGFAIASGVRMILREVLPRGAEQAIEPGAIWGVSTFRQLAPCPLGEEPALVARLVDRVVPCNVGETIPRTIAGHIFILFYLWLLWQLWRGRFNLVTAAFLTYFSQLMLGQTFRVWYPAWLVPLAAIHLTPATFWRTTLFGLTSELSIVNYFVVWRWWLRDLPWDKLGLITRVSPYWPVMHTLTVPWVFGIPLLGPILSRWWSRRSRS